MREIKFRAWDIENKYFVNSNRYFIELDDGTTWFNLGTDEGSDNLVDQSFKLELMQYTGLKDKNGKEIYSGDILNGYHNKGCEKCGHNARTVHYEVVFEDGMFATKGHPQSLERQMAYSSEPSEFEVIGNIYENGDLL